MVSHETAEKTGVALGALASTRRIVEETATRRQDAGAPGKFAEVSKNKRDERFCARLIIRVGVREMLREQCFFPPKFPPMPQKADDQR